MKRIISLLLVLVMLLSVAACGKSKETSKSTSTESSSTGNSSPDSSADSIIDDLQSQEGSSSSDPNGFDNTSGTDVSTPTPGQSESSTTDSDSSSNNTSSGGASAVEDRFPDMEYNESILSRGENQFYYEGNGYAYGITADGNEAIAFLEDDGELIDVLGGGGFYNVGTFLNYGDIKSFTRDLVDGEMAVTVTYEPTGYSANVSVLKNTYVFHQNSITATIEIDTYSAGSPVNSASVQRTYLAETQETEKKIMYEWIYPENGDYPYQKSDGICIKQWFDDEHLIYFFNRDSNQAEYYYLPSYPENYFSVPGSGAKGFSYSFVCDIVLENPTKSKDIDYTAFFKGRDSEFAVGLAPITPTNDNSTVFVGDEAELNLNITNLTDDELYYSIRYDVMDYYGNVVDAGLFINNTIPYGMEVNRNIKVKDKYGMYWVNLYIVSPISTYYECYPFMLVEDYDFLYRDDSPFGIDALHAYSQIEVETNASICNKLGVRYTRGGDLALIQKYGMQTSATQIAQGPYTTQASVDKILTEWNKAKEYGGYNYMVGVNEYDGDVKFNLEACREKMLDFLPNYFNLVAPFVQKHNIKFAYNASTHGNEAWHQAMYENGIWQASNVIDTHYYCYPMPPDKLASTVGTRENELNMETMLSLFEKYGGRDKKLYSIGETGYPTSPEGSTHINEQADYNTRIGILALAHGADQVHYYCLLDRTSYYKGTNSWSEMNFGAFMCYDYYDIVKPKPWAAAYSNLTRQLDGVTSVKESAKYDTDGEGTVRAFDVENRQGDDLIVAWSNVYVHPQATSQGVGQGIVRQPNLPWNNIWPETEDVVFDATGKTVTVIDTMGNVIGKYTAQNGKVTIPLSGSPVYIYGVK